MSDVREWLKSLKAFGMRQNLETTAVLLARLGMPQDSFPAIHVAGSNGKGTTSVIMANCLTASGICCGLFTSPHLCFVEERIRIDGVPISSDAFDANLEKIRVASKINPQTPPTFYEATFLVAMLAFQDAGIDRAIIETGLGGRLDSTRLVYADCCVLTELALEHTEILGETLAEIAAEKAAIARPGQLFIAKWTYDRNARNAIEAAVGDHRLGFWWRPDRAMIVNFEDANKSHRPISELALPSDWTSYHLEAAIMADAALSLLQIHETRSMMPSALLHTVWPGRAQNLTIEDVPIFLDAAHNSSGMEKTCSHLMAQMEDDEAPSPSVVVIGCTPQTDLVAFLNPIVNLIVEGEVKDVIITEPQNGRRPGLDCDILQKELMSQGISANIESHPDPKIAIEQAIKLAKEDGCTPVLGIGSLYLVGNLLSALGLDTPQAMTTYQPSDDAEAWI